MTTLSRMRWSAAAILTLIAVVIVTGAFLLRLAVLLASLR